MMKSGCPGGRGGKRGKLERPMRYKPLLILVADILIEEEETRALFSAPDEGKADDMGAFPSFGAPCPFVHCMHIM